MLHKRFDFTKLGGFPLTQERLAYMQDAYEGLDSNLLAIIGNENVIVQGCDITEDSGTYTVSDGWIIFSNQLVPFIGGTSDTLNISKRNIVTALTFEDSTDKNVQTYNYATFSTMPGHLLSDFIRLEVSVATLSQAAKNQSYGIHTSANKYDLAIRKAFGNFIRIDGVLRVDMNEFLTEAPVDIEVPDAIFDFDPTWFDGWDLQTILHVWSANTSIGHMAIIFDCSVALTSYSDGPLTFRINCSEAYGNINIQDWKGLIYLNMEGKIKQL